MDRWYRNGVIYSLDIETFQDSDDDGVGDLCGLTDRLDYLARLGVDTIWLNPCHPSPRHDGGYDITDYYGIDPRFGTLGDFAELVSQADEAGIRIVLDLVVNHTSDEHPWFRSALSGREAPYHDWYVWADHEPADRWEGCVFPGSEAETWSYAESVGRWYRHRFYRFQPELDVDHPEVRAELAKIVTFWLRLGVAGFRGDHQGHRRRRPHLARRHPDTGPVSGNRTCHRSLRALQPSERHHSEAGHPGVPGRGAPLRDHGRPLPSPGRQRNTPETHSRAESGVGVSMEFRVLGPVEFVVDDRVVPTGHPRQRCVLAVLLIEVNRTVPTEQLIDRVWGERPPARARNVLSGYMTRLRAVISAGETSLDRRPGGYSLSADPRLIDLHRFRDLATRGRAAQDPELLAGALNLWRGLPFADTASDWLLNMRATLENERLEAHLRRNEILLGRGGHAELLAELHDLATAHPLDERVTRQLVIALYRCGRQADALAAYSRSRALLSEELGLDPSPESQALQRQILGSDPALTTAPPPPASRPVPRQLPAVTADFTGRGGELALLDATGTTPVVTIDGAAGVGKTALAVSWGRRVAGRFPDGQLFVNLRGYSPGRPLSTLGALAQFLRALGVPPDQLPLDVDEAAALYRSVLAERRVLVVLDDARGPGQVRPLLPGNPGCTVVITSRNRLGGLIAKDGAQRLTLDVLDPRTAIDLLSRLLGAQRVAREPEAAAELARLCTHLPLALRIAAANLANHPHRPIAEHAAELRAGNRLDKLQIDGDREAAVRTAFELSYAALEPDARLAFRRIGLVPGPDFTAASVAVLLPGSAEESARLLETLSAAHLVEPATAGRYRCHDLLKLFAAELARTDDDRTAALDRLVAAGVEAARSAAVVLYPHMLRLPGGVPDREVFTDHSDALAWLDGERAGLVALIEHAASHGPRRVAWQLADTLRGYFWLRRCADDWLATARTALAAAQEAGDPLAQAAARLSLADVHWSVGQHAEAMTNYAQALEHARRAGWADGQATILGNLAGVNLERGELALARENYTGALELHREKGRRAVTLSNLGNLDWEQGALADAQRHFIEALELHESPVAMANSLVNLGCVRHDLGLPADQSLADLTEALALAREIGDDADEANALVGVAAVLRDAGKPADAHDRAREALELARRIGGRRIETCALNVLGSISQRLARPAEAVEHHSQALELSAATGDRRAEVEALTGVADAMLALGRPGAAAGHAARAVALAEEAGYRLLAGYAEVVLADADRLRGDAASAAAHAGRAAEAFASTGGRLWVSRLGQDNPRP